MSYEKITVAQARKAEAVGKSVLLQGWVRTRRDSKAGFSFVELNDGSSFGNVQILVPKELPNYETDIKQITAGSSIAVQGIVKESPGQGQATEIEARSVELIGTADPTTYPLQKKGHSLEFLRSIAHLRVRTNTFGAVARVRNRVSFSIHQFFQENGFFYVHTPIITASDCEGAGQMFHVSTFDPNNPPKDDKGSVDFSKDFFSKASYLTVSGQLNVETYCAG
jgi:asparaginyl-tRNA synthetase